MPRAVEILVIFRWCLAMEHMASVLWYRAQPLPPSPTPVLCHGSRLAVSWKADNVVWPTACLGEWLPFRVALAAGKSKEARWSDKGRREGDRAPLSPDHRPAAVTRYVRSDRRRDVLRDVVWGIRLEQVGEAEVLGPGS